MNPDYKKFLRKFYKKVDRNIDYVEFFVLVSQTFYDYIS